MRYKVKLTFKYGKDRLMPGDEWVPVGGKFDKSIKQHFVYPVDDDEFASAKKVTKKRGRTSNK